MKTEKFIRKSFPVDGVQVTEDNFEQVAKWTKGKICYTDPKIAEKLKRPVQKWIEIEVKNPLNDRQTKAFVGDYVLWANNGFKIYTPGAFEKSFDRAPKPQAPKAKIHMDKPERHADVNPKPGPRELTDAEIARLETMIEEHNKGELKETIVETPVGQATVVTAPDGLVHKHPIDARCDANGCEADRYADGIHIFTDITVKADANGYAPVTL